MDNALAIFLGLVGAGGVGGLLYLKRNGTIYIPHCDAYGNVMRYTDTAGNIVAEYTYDAFGKTISQAGQMADIFRMRFSTKYYDSETDLYYYGYRFYSPSLMRWLNRDPIEEDGGLNLYGFCWNNPISRIDPNGKRVLVQNHLIGQVPPGGWESPASAAETVFIKQRHNTKEWCVFKGNLRFSVEIMPDPLVVHIYRRQIQTSNPVSDNAKMAIACAKEQDHVAIARKIDRAFHLYKYQVESINAKPADARRQKAAYEALLNQTIKRLHEENRALDRKGGPHDL